MMNNKRVTADFNTLLEQGATTAAHYMRAAINAIDDSFGAGYASKHPELVAGFMSAAAADLSSAVLAKTIPDALDELAYAVTKIADNMPDS